MANIICVGAQWGDEGKGKIIDVLTERADVVVRSQGGNNAGHTVISGKKKYVLHLVPSGILHKGKVCVIGNGVVIDPVSLVGEIEGLRAQGVKVTPRNLLISESAHVVLPTHRILDGLRESSMGKNKIGTTGRGIGPTYADKIGRVGIRMCELIRPDVLKLRLKERLEATNAAIKEQGGKPVAMKSVMDSYLAAAEVLRPHVVNTVTFLHEAVSARREILFEGAQGTYLDIDFGTYPYVTSSNTTSGGACTGSGVAPNRMDRVLGVVKAYTTRVGEGPFPTEDAALSDRMHGMGREFGATTGRARRCGWFDAVMVRYAAILNGMDEIAVTNLDGLDGIEILKLCVAYKLDGQFLDTPPASAADLARCQPVYFEMEGWSKPTAASKSYKDLPGKARKYLDTIAELTGTKLRIVSVGPNRKETILL